MPSNVSLLCEVPTPFRCQMEMQDWNQRYSSLKFLGDPPEIKGGGYQQADGISGQKTNEGVSTERKR